MSRSIPVLILITLAACSSSRQSSGFRLSKDGDAQRGRAAFVSHKCNTCHSVSGSGLPAPTVKPPVPVELGREQERKLSDAYLVASIVDPDGNLGNYPKDKVTFRGHSRMPGYADTLTVRELTDIVAFLQAENRSQ